MFSTTYDLSPSRHDTCRIVQNFSEISDRYRDQSDQLTQSVKGKREKKIKSAQERGRERKSVGYTFSITSSRNFKILFQRESWTFHTGFIFPSHFPFRIWFSYVKTFTKAIFIYSLHYRTIWNSSGGIFILKYFGETRIYVLLIPKCVWYVKHLWIDLCYNDMCRVKRFCPPQISSKLITARQLIVWQL